MTNEEVDKLLSEYSRDTVFLSYNAYDHPAAIALHDEGKNILSRLLYWLKKGKEQKWKDDEMGGLSSKHIPVWIIISLIGDALQLDPPPREHMGELVGMKLDEEVDWILENAKEYE